MKNSNFRNKNITKNPKDIKQPIHIHPPKQLHSQQQQQQQQQSSSSQQQQQLIHPSQQQLPSEPLQVNQFVTYIQSLDSVLIQQDQSIIKQRIQEEKEEEAIRGGQDNPSNTRGIDEALLKNAYSYEQYKEMIEMKIRARKERHRKKGIMREKEKEKEKKKISGMAKDGNINSSINNRNDNIGGYNNERKYKKKKGE
ncbi:MAG: hypothetical protein EZS28_029764 [Streblomastix strix]|uniref:Uncharacterized protein n=1 Tax=Streblomastix strix TaxID=222440 RepID=A0A5J4UW88_9EUKA|nr:MAG: hypothetical protein EZS28_029764 [Streblomastix strix]